jgi:hypothetical protein
VASTQVLECQRSAELFAGGHRILKPGGLLILSTHGMVEEHGARMISSLTSRGLENWRR